MKTWSCASIIRFSFLHHWNTMIVPLGEHTTHLRLWKLPIGLCCFRHTTHIPWWLLYSSLFPVWLRNLLPLVCVGIRCQRVEYKLKWGQNQSWIPGAVWPKKRKGIHFCSCRCSRLNPRNYLEAVDFGGSCGLWGQLSPLEASTSWSKTRSESELTPQCQQAQRPS